MAVKKADEPLCPFCFEDTISMVTAIRDGRRVTMFCATCGKSWAPKDKA
jgi:transcription elongation factor Elf1